MSRKRKIELLWFGILSVGLVALILTANQLTKPNEDQTRCLLNHAVCEAQIGDRKLSLSISPQPIKSLTPLVIEATIEGKQPDSIWIDLQGESMYMGVNQPQMQREKDRWSATTELAVCTTGRMIWRLALQILDGDQQTEAVFFFEAQ